MEKFFKDITSIQIITFIFGLLMMIFAASALVNKSDTVSIFALMFSVVIILISAINPDTLLNFILIQTKDGLELRFNRHHPSQKEKKETLDFVNKADDFTPDDFKNNLLYQEAIQRPRKERSDVDFLLIATQLWKEKKHEESLREAYQGISITNDKKILSYLEMRIASVFKAMKQYNIAINQLTKSITINPSNIHAYFNLANIEEFINNDLEKTESIYRKTLNIDENSIYGNHNMGMILTKQNKTEEAEIFFRKTLDLEKNHFQTIMTLASLLKNKGEIEEAESLYNKALSIDNENIYVKSNLAVLLKEKGNITKAESLYRELLENDDNNTVTLNNLSMLLLEKKEFEESEKLLRKGLIINENFPPLYNSLSLLYRKQGNDEEANKMFIRYQELLNKI